MCSESRGGCQSFWARRAMNSGIEVKDAVVDADDVERRDFWCETSDTNSWER